MKDCSEGTVDSFSEFFEGVTTLAMTMLECDTQAVKVEGCVVFDLT